MNGMNRSRLTFYVSGKLAIATLIALACSISAQAADLTLLSNDELDLVSAGNTSASVHAHAGALGPHTYTNTNARADVHVQDNGYLTTESASALGSATASGVTSTATVDVHATLSINATINHQMSHTVDNRKFGFSHAFGHVYLAGHKRNK